MRPLFFLTKQKGMIMAKRYRFKVLNSPHFDKNGKEWLPGQTLRSDERLDKKYKNKFVLHQDMQKDEPVEKVLVTDDRKAVYRKEERSHGWFDVVSNVTGEKLNDKAMREKEADEIIERAG